ncbi:MAG: efflux RND transporter permease subunit [Stellaceae bacterium]
MLRAIVRSSLAYPWLVILVAVALASAGALALRTADYDVFPEFAPPTVTIHTPVAGLAPEDVEALVTTPIENAVIGVPGLARLRSQSAAGMSVIIAVFRDGTDLYRDRDMVAERLAAAAPLLPAAARPLLVPAESATGNVRDFGLTSARLSLIQLTELARREILPALLAVPGVADVIIFGARPQQWQVRVKPAVLLAAHVGLNQVLAAAGAASAVRGAGVIDTANQRFQMQSYGQAGDLAQLAETVIDGRTAAPPLTLGDVARISVGAPPATGAALVGQKPGLQLIVSALYGANALAVARGVRQTLDRLRPALARQGAELDLASHALEPSGFIEKALHDLRNSLLIGAGLILIVIFAALRNWRVALIAFATLPLALFLAILVLDASGFSINTLVLGGLVIALGIIVDDAIIDIENIRRRLHENQERPQPLTRLRVILDAALEVRIPIIFATLAIVIIFLPMLALGGLAGRLFAPLALAVIIAVLASLALAVTVTPALAAVLLGRGGIAAADPLFVRMARRLHRRALAATRRHGRAGLALFAALALAALASLAFLPARFLPRFHENDVIGHFMAPPGTSLATMQRLGRRTAAILQRMPQVAHVIIHMGTAALNPEHGPTNRAEIDITLSEQGARHGAAAERAILAAIGGVPGVRFWAHTFMSERIHEVISATSAPVVVHIFGTDLPALDADAQRVAAVLRRVPGAGPVAIAAPPATPSIALRLRRDALRRYGFQPQTVLDAIQAASVGRTVGRVYRAGTSWPITVLLPALRHPDPAAIGALPLVDDHGRIVPLGALATITVHDGRSTILHEGARRVQNVMVESVRGGAGTFLHRAQTALAGAILSPGTYLAYGGTATASRAARRTLLFAGLAAAAAVIALLTVALGRLRPALLLALNLPFALLGGIAALWLVRLPLSLGAEVGLIAVFGITLRNGLMLFAHYRHLVTREGFPWSIETAEHGAVERVVPVLLTAGVAALGLLPLAVGAGLPGQEIEGPMAIVILGGLFSSTPLTLLALPGLAARLLGPEHLAGPPAIP